MAVLINGYLVNLQARTDAELQLVLENALARRDRVARELEVLEAEIVCRRRSLKEAA